MAVGDFVHWFIGNFCQLDCGYCQFKTLGEKEENSRLEMAKKFIDIVMIVFVSLL